MSRVVVTGASGFVGRSALSALRARGHEVHAICRHPPGNGDVDGIVWHASDVLDTAATGGVIAGLRAERLLHLAWVTEYGAYWSSPENPSWVEATKELVARFTEAGGTRVVCAGTCAEYDWNDQGVARTNCDEVTTPTVPRTLYGASKLAITAWLGSRGRSWASGRVFFAYGEGEDSRRFVPSVVRALLQGDRARTGPGGLLRDFMHVADVGAALVALLESDICGPVNIGSGAAITLAELAGTIAEIVGQPDAVDIGALPGKPFEPPRIVASVDRLRRDVGFSPSIDLETGLRRTVAWWRAATGETSGTGRSHAY